MLSSKAELAWPTGDQPGSLDFRHPVSEEIVEAIEGALEDFLPSADAGNVLFRALTSTEGPVGRYLVSSAAGQCFVRVSSRHGNPPLEKSITDFLLGQGVSVNPLLVAGHQLQWNRSIYRVDVRPLVTGRHFDGSLSDLESLARTLAQCHRALREFPVSNQVRDLAADRCQRLQQIKESIRNALMSGDWQFFREYSRWALMHQDWLHEMVEHIEPDLHTQAGAQCIHGEVHPGNVIFRSCDGSPVLVDFEESVHLFAPPEWDLAFLVQRFCLRDSPSLDVLDQRLQRVALGYGGPLPELASVMRQIAWFTLATIVDLRISQGTVSPVQEWDKFVKLERQALQYQGIL